MDVMQEKTSRDHQGAEYRNGCTRSLTVAARCAWMIVFLFIASVVVLSCSQPGVTAQGDGGDHSRFAARTTSAGTCSAIPRRRAWMRRAIVTRIRMSPRSMQPVSPVTRQSDGDTMHNGKLSNGNAQAVKNVTCIDCHGGNDVPGIPAKLAKGDPQFEHFKHLAHVEQSRPDIWVKDSARNPEVLGGKSLLENVDYIRFVNPGDLRAAQASCGALSQHRSRRAYRRQGQEEHDDHGHAAVGSRALQQRRLPQQDRGLWRKLFAGWDAAEDSAGDPTDRQRRRKSRHDRGVVASASMGNHAAGQYPPRLRAWRKDAPDHRRAQSRGRFRQARRETLHRAVMAPKCAPIRSGSLCRKRACSIQPST